MSSFRFLFSLNMKALKCKVLFTPPHRVSLKGMKLISLLFIFSLQTTSLSGLWPSLSATEKALVCPERCSQQLWGCCWCPMSQRCCHLLTHMSINVWHSPGCGDRRPGEQQSPPAFSSNYLLQRFYLLKITPCQALKSLKPSTKLASYSRKSYVFLRFYIVIHRAIKLLAAWLVYLLS